MNVERMLMEIASEPAPASMRAKVFRPRGAWLPLSAAALLVATLVALPLLPRERPKPAVFMQEKDPIRTLVSRWLAGEDVRKEIEWLGAKALPELRKHPKAAALHDEIAAKPLRILYVTRTPSYEYRFLKNALIGDPDLHVHCFLTSADRDFPQERSKTPEDPRFEKPLAALPEDLLGYDVILLGDAELEQESLVDFVRLYGGGLVMLSSRSPETLVPVIPENESDDQVLAISRPGGVLRSWTDGALPPGLSRITTSKLKEGAESALRAGAWPLCVVRKEGRGRVFWSASNELWRWRHEVGEYPWFYPLYRTAVDWTAGRDLPSEEEFIREADLIVRGKPKEVRQIQGGVVDYNTVTVQFEKFAVLRGKASTDDWVVLSRGQSGHAWYGSWLKARFETGGGDEAIWVFRSRDWRGARVVDWIRLPLSEAHRVR